PHGAAHRRAEGAGEDLRGQDLRPGARRPRVQPGRQRGGPGLGRPDLHVPGEVPQTVRQWRTMNLRSGCVAGWVWVSAALPAAVVPAGAAAADPPLQLV